MDRIRCGIAHPCSGHASADALENRENPVIVEQMLLFPVQIDIGRFGGRGAVVGSGDRGGGPGLDPAENGGIAELGLSDLRESREVLVADIRIDVGTGAVFAEVVVGLIVECRLENRRAGGASGEVGEVVRCHGGHLRPCLADDAGAEAERAEFLARRQLHAGTDVETLVPQSLFPTGLAVIPIVVIFLRSRGR